MTQKHTPGPWVSSPDPEEIPPAKVVRADGFDIATAWGGYFSADADLRLIESAPDMLQSLREVVDTCRADCPAGLDALIAARAAIARATGGAA